jgi:hypothetical protein
MKDLDVVLADESLVRILDDTEPGAHLGRHRAWCASWTTQSLVLILDDTEPGARLGRHRAWCSSWTTQSTSGRSTLQT